jgi:hypothetical protein
MVSLAVSCTPSAIPRLNNRPRAPAPKPSRAARTSRYFMTVAEQFGAKTEIISVLPISPTAA